MRRYTDTYHLARLSGARPLFLLYFGTDRGFRCFGKHTPTPEQIGTTYNAFEWSARVLTFGDFRQSLSSNSESFLQSLFEEEVSSYGATLDNADGYFSEIAGREIILNGQIILLQGFDYPGFVYDDFQPLYFGTIDTFDFDEKTFKFTSVQAFRPQTPEDPSVDSTSIYAQTLAGTGTMAAESFTYADLENAFYNDDSWTLTVEIERDATLNQETLFRLENDTYGSTRLECGIDATDKPYIKYTENAGTATPTYTTKTADFTMGLGSTRLEYIWDTDTGTVTFKDDKGNISIISLSSDIVYIYDSQYGTSGSGIGEFSQIRGISWGANSLFVCDHDNKRIQRFDTDWNIVDIWDLYVDGDVSKDPLYPHSVCYDSRDNVVYVASSISESIADAGRIQCYTLGGTYLSVYPVDGSEIFVLGQVCTDTLGNVYATKLGFTDYIIKFTSFPESFTRFGSSGSGDGQFDEPRGIAVDPAGNIYVADDDNNRIQKFDDEFTFLTKWGGEGATQLNSPTWLGWSSDGNLVVADTENTCYKIFDTSGNFVSKFGKGGTGDGEFSWINGVALHPSGSLICADNNRIEIFTKSFAVPQIDFLSHSPTPTTQDETVTAGENSNGLIGTMAFSSGSDEPTFQLVNDMSDSESTWKDKIEGNDLLVEDGTWEEWVITESVTETLTPDETFDPLAELPLEDTSQYSSPGENQQNVILPLPYGNLRENSDGGVWVCPLIDSVNYVYCVAGWPIQSVANGNIVDVYIDGVLQSSGYTFDESNNYESQGNIAILDFTSDPGGEITVKCNGKWVDATLLQNPIDIIEDLLEYAATLTGSEPWQINESSFAIARNIADIAGYQCAGIMQSNNTLGFWVKSILKSFLGDFRFNADGEMEIKLTPLSESESVQEWLEEYESITLNAKQILNNICGRIIINYANSLTQIDRRYKEGGESSYFRTADKSQSAINPQSWTLDFDWCRNTSNIELMQDILLALYADPEYLVSYQGQDFKYVPLNLTDQVKATVSFLRDSENNIVENVVYSIREKTINLDNFTTSLTLQSVNFASISIPSNYVRYNGNYVTYNGERIIYN